MESMQWVLGDMEMCMQGGRTGLTLILVHGQLKALALSLPAVRPLA